MQWPEINGTLFIAFGPLRQRRQRPRRLPLGTPAAENVARKPDRLF